MRPQYFQVRKGKKTRGSVMRFAHGRGTPARLEDVRVVLEHVMKNFLFCVACRLP